MFLCLMTFLGACSQEVRTEKLPAPPELLRDCQETVVALDLYEASIRAGSAFAAVVSNGDLVRKIQALRSDLRRCNADKAALRLWSQEGSQ